LLGRVRGGPAAIVLMSGILYAIAGAPPGDLPLTVLRFATAGNVFIEVMR